MRPAREPPASAAVGATVFQACKIRSSAEGAVCRDERLSEAQTPVAGGNLGMSENFKFVGFQFANQLFEHKQVVECAAAQADPIDRGFFAQQAREAHESFDQSVVKSAADCFRAHFPAEILDDGAE